ncbi:hypothetical protein DND132_2800 [Pseudodesulfovibrio mercurii]|uniref:Uncharacterized protein n=1 Tax=Pseudodesulfovibrio mercurii TaxID=641491 RepID=F0JJA4_9BACT|nr:hypothetical protein [Pseudodesulfovibrio mercurii]EGB16003.1 hypothetical protein DND132_2800 [Pseudodesulfovibrio mercurii]
MDTRPAQELATFIDTWTTDPNRTKDCFTALKCRLEGLDGIKLDFVSRPGITHSLRAAHENQRKRNLFAMVDIIDDDPDDRWLSVCFYSELVDDPDGLGDEVPGGLLGEDARCFDLYEGDDDMVRYIGERLAAACRAAAGE